MRTAIALPPLPESERSAVMKRRLFNQTTASDEHIEEQAVRLRQEAQGTRPGVEREKLIRQARKAEAVARIQEWLSSAGLQPPKKPKTDLKMLDRGMWRAGVRVIRNDTERSGTIVKADGEIKVKWDDGRTSYYRRTVPTDIRLEEAVTHESS
jgi:hypothetical protein